MSWGSSSIPAGRTATGVPSSSCGSVNPLNGQRSSARWVASHPSYPGSYPLPACGLQSWKTALMYTPAHTCTRLRSFTAASPMAAHGGGARPTTGASAAGVQRLGTGASHGVCPPSPATRPLASSTGAGYSSSQVRACTEPYSPAY